MRRLVPIMVWMCSLISSAQAPISVYDCDAYNPPTQTMVESSSPEFYRGCVRFANQTYNFGNTTNMAVESASSVEMYPGFEAGGFTGSGQMTFEINGGSWFPIMLMNYPNLYSVERYRKMELGIQLPEPYKTYLNNFIAKQNNPNLTFPPGEVLNPFLEWDIDVEAQYYHQDGWKVCKAEGFFYRDMVRNASTDLWDEVATPYNFRIRFSPPELGNWLAVVTIKVNGTTIAVAPGFQFNVVDGSHPGFVTVHANHRNFQRDGQLIYPVGQNFLGELPDCNNYGADYNESHIASKVSCWTKYLNLISDYGKLGGKYLRVLESPRFNLLEWEEKGNYFKRMHYASETDNFLDTLKKYDMLCIYNLMLQTPFMSYANYDDWPNDWDHYQRDHATDAIFYDYNETSRINPYNDNPGPNGKQPHEMFLNESDLQYHQQRTRYVISRYGYSAQIYMFEPLSECFHLDQLWTQGGVSQTEPYFDANNPKHAIVQQAVNNYVTRIAHYIKDSMQHTQQLIGLNAVKDVWTPATTLSGHDPSINNSIFDAVGINYYGSVPDRLYISNANQVPILIEDFSRGRSRPVYISEGGHINNCDLLSQGTGSFEVMDNMQYGFLGAAGFHLWHTFDGNQYNLWQMQVRAKNHMNAHTRNVLSNMNGSWNQNSQIAYEVNGLSLKENFYYVSENQELATGVIRNRTFNLTTEVSSSSPCYDPTPASSYPYFSKQDLDWTMGNPVKVEELKTNTNYIIEYYSYKDGNYLGYECQNTGLFSRSLVLHHPILTNYSGKNPIVWYIVYQNNCKSGIVKDSKQSAVNGTFSEGLSEDSKQTIRVYPNPVEDVLKLEVPADFTYILTDLSGKLILQGAGSAGNNRIVIDFLSSGNYMLTIQTEFENRSVLIVKR